MITMQNEKNGERLTIPHLIQSLCEDICDNYCKYRDTCDENCYCDITREGKPCPLDILNY